MFFAEPDAWVLKGATALLARLHGAARHSMDIDLYRPGADVDAAEQALRDAAAIDLDDFFRFTLAPGRGIGAGRLSIRVPVTVYLGATEFARFHVDLVAGLQMTGRPELVEPLVPIELDGIRLARYRVYPIVDHVADKVCAMLEVHPRAEGPAQPSTRYRALVDLALIAHTQQMASDSLGRALRSEAARRDIALPASLPTPDAPGWRPGYARVARDVPGLEEQDLESGLATARRLIDPVLAGTATGRWELSELRWVPEPDVP